MPSTVYDTRVTPFLTRMPVTANAPTSPTSSTCVPPQGHPSVSGRITTTRGEEPG